MVGLQITKEQLNQQIGDVTLILKRNYDKCVSINEFLLRTSDFDLVALGFSSNEVSIIKSAFADLAFQKVNAFDSSTFVKQLYGIG